MKKILMNMRLIIQYQFILCVIFFNTNFSSMFPNAYQYAISKTDLKTRQLGQYSMPLVDAQMAMPLEDSSNKLFALYMAGIFTQSNNTDFGCAFSIDRKKIMKVAGDNTSYKFNRDIRAEFVGGDSDTNANMSLLGKQQMFGGKFLMQCSLENIFKSNFFKDWFFSIRTVFVYLQQQLIMELEGDSARSLLEIRNFFANVVQQAKIDSRVRSSVNLENITLSLDGIYKTKNNGLEIYYYSGIEIPTNLTYSSPYLFDSIIGNNGTIGLLLGADFHGYFYNKPDIRIGVLLEIEDHFLLYKTMNRTFDLYSQKFLKDGVSRNNQNKPWSRYLPAVFLKNTNKNLLVGEVSTLPVRMHECDVLDVSVGLIGNFISKNNTKLYLAAGYNLWMSQPEYPELQDRVYPKEYHEFYDCGIRGSLPNTTASYSSINYLANDDPSLEDFIISDLDYGSVSSDGGYSQTIFLRGTAIGCTGISVLLGGWYEIGKKRMIPSRIGGWIGCGFEF